MLPDRSKRYASLDGEIPRLGLSTNWQLLLLTAIMLGLLYLVFPKKALVEQLYEQETLDPLTLSYIQNLYRADARNPDAAILLSKFDATELDLAALERRLLPHSIAGDARQRSQARTTLLAAYERALARQPAPAEAQRLRERMINQLRLAAEDEASAAQARQLAVLAFRLGQPALVDRLLRRFDDAHTVPTLEAYGLEALGQQQYALAASYFFMARMRATERDAARRLLRRGVDALMAGGLYAQAMDDAARYLHDLGDDLPTLRYLVRAALACGAPAEAAAYARRLVFRPEVRRPA